MENLNSGRYTVWIKLLCIGHEIWLRIFSEIVVFAHRKWWVVGGSESNACRLARSPRIGRERQIYPGAVRPSQRSAKYWLRAQNRSNKSIETTNLPADDQSQPPTRWKNFSWYFKQKNYFTTIFHHFSSTFCTVIKISDDLVGGSKKLKKIDIFLRFFKRIFLIKIFWSYTKRGL